jgi:signal transduction histidine kinase
MKSRDGNYLTIGPRLTLTFALLIALILGGNGILVWQLHRARLQTDRLTSVSQQLIAVLRLQESLQSFHQRLDELAQSKDAPRLETEGAQLRRALVEQTQRTRSALTSMPFVNPAFAPTLDAIEKTLPRELERITALATLADWKAVRFRLDIELKPVETLTSTLVGSIDQDLSEELPQAIANMRNVQLRILLIVPTTALATVFIAAFFGWGIARRILELRLEERVYERTRIARELHDTLLQSFQGLLLHLQAVSNVFSTRPEEAKQRLDEAIDQVAQAITEGRDAVQGLRAPTRETKDLAEALSALGEELGVDKTNQNRPVFDVELEGAPQRLHPMLRYEVFRIASEALRNAFRHAQAQRIEVQIRYDEHQLRLRIRDDGRGIDSQILADKGRKGHWGLRGMHERAKLVGGSLEVLSKLDSGTEIQLTIPASAAYLSSRARTRAVVSGRNSAEVT